jgi:hypothetical protein
VKQHVCRAGIVGRVAGKALDPMEIAADELFMARLSRIQEPTADRGLVKMDENSFAKLFDGRKPIGVAGN